MWLDHRWWGSARPVVNEGIGSTGVIVVLFRPICLPRLPRAKQFHTTWGTTTLAYNANIRDQFGSTQVMQNDLDKLGYPM